MAKFDHRIQDLMVSAAAAHTPAWFAAPTPACGAEGAAHWDWLDDAQDSRVEVTEFAVTDGFIEALFGVATPASTGVSLAA